MKQENQVTEVEQKAMDMGWKPLDEFHGKKEDWRGADEFLERGEKILPIVKENSERARKEAKRLSAEVASLKEMQAKSLNQIQELAKLAKSADARGYEKAMKELQIKQREAVKEADTAAYDDATDKIKDLTKDAAKQAKAEVPEKPEVLVPPEFDEWNDKNKWYGVDPDMTAYANSVALYIDKTKPGLKGKDYFDALTKEIEAKFPDNFRNLNRDNGDGAEPRTPTPTKKGGKSFSDMPEAAQKMCNEFVADGTFKSKAEYLKVYWGEE